MRNRFTDPITGGFYDWQLNHDPQGEESFAPDTSVEWLAAIDGPPIPQLGQEGPLVIQLRGTILHRNQYVQMSSYYKLCAREGRTVYFRDFRGDEYEVLITMFNPKREGVMRNPQDFANAPDHIWRYDLRMEVVRVISGAWI